MSLIARLIEAGTPPDLIEEVAMLIAEQRALEKRRENDRQRQQDRRDRQAGHVTSRDVTDVTDAAPFPAPPNENNLTPPTHTPENITPRAKAADFPRPDFIEAPLWADLLKNRKTKRLTNTPTAHEELLADLAELSARTGWPPGKVLKACVARGWGAIFETDKMKEAINGRQPANQQIPRGGAGQRDNRDGFERACDRAIQLAEAGRPADGGIGGGGQRALAAPGSV
ncbi:MULTISPECIES: hypothetical protein [Alphaproteobacteria]|uniref:hypothetical protein n=1 Tax=Sphingopyxis sp. TaxID=1908224 RepID=UPI004034B6E2